MAVTYGFYNSLNGDRTYNAEQMSAIFDGIITDGVFSSIGGALMTIAGEGMQVLVKTGKAWFNGTWTLNDAQMALPVSTSDVSLTRIDAVVLEVNSSVSVRENSIKIVKGTPSANPTKPTMAADEDLHQYALAYITVGAGVTSITSSNIEVNVGMDSCPFITSVLQQTSITDLFNQWEGEFDAWFANIQSQLKGDVAANLQHQIDTVNENIEISDATKTQYGLTDTAIDPYLQFLGKYNEHWWKLTSGSIYSYISYTEKKENVTKTYILGYCYLGNYSVQIAKSVDIDSNGNITLVNPTNISLKTSTGSASSSISKINEILSNAPCYLTTTYDTSNIFYLPSSSSYSNETILYSKSSGDYEVYINNNAQIVAQLVTANAKSVTVYPDQQILKHSTDRNAYPDSGTVDDITYEYLGVPFEKFPTPPQIEMGSYTGTGTAGSNNHNTLTFSFEPKVVFVSLVNGWQGFLIFIRGVTETRCTTYTTTSNKITVNWGTSKTVDWYDNGSNVYAQFNYKNNTYNYVALG